MTNPLQSPAPDAPAPVVPARDAQVGATIGVEEEFHVVDAVTGALAPAAQDLVTTPAQVEPELHRSMIETATGIHDDLTTLRADLLLRRGGLVTAAGRLGLAVVASGTVPGSGVPGSRVYPNRRYEWIAQEYRQLVVEQQVCACQVQVNVPDRDLAVRVARRVRGWLPVLLALSGSSPMFLGADTGYASFRTIAISRWPTVGPPPDIANAQEYDALVQTLIGSGVISDAGMIYFDARPSARYPTVEIRVADACPLVDDVVLLAALSRALVETAAADDAAGVPLPETPSMLLRAATWRAARSGLATDLIDPIHTRSLPAGDLVWELLSRVRPALEERGDWDTVVGLTRALLARGSSSQRQRRLLASGATDAELVASIVAETSAGL